MTKPAGSGLSRAVIDVRGWLVWDGTTPACGPGPLWGRSSTKRVVQERDWYESIRMGCRFFCYAALSKFIARTGVLSHRSLTSVGPKLFFRNITSGATPAPTKRQRTTYHDS